MILPSYYYINEYNIFIKFVNDKIIINLINMQQNIFEIIINSENLNDILIINDNKLSLYGFYLVLIDLFELINDYFIELFNNDKYIRITFRDNSFNVKCILWIKEKKYKYIDDNSYLEIIDQVIEEINNTPKTITFYDYIISLIKKIF